MILHIDFLQIVLIFRFSQRAKDSSICRYAICVELVKMLRYLIAGLLRDGMLAIAHVTRNPAEAASKLLEVNLPRSCVSLEQSLP